MEIKTSFPEQFFREETRCDFTVTTKQKEIWAVEIDLLCEFDRVCKKNNIRYYASMGTLLGAVRHKGFIPWDDDLDVCVLREDFEKLCNLSEEFSDPYFFQTALTDRKYFCGYARLRNSSTTGVILQNASVDYNNGIFIDIYVLDGFSTDDRKLKKQLLDLKLYSRSLYTYNMNPISGKGIQRLENRLIRTVARKFFTYEKLVLGYNRVLSKYNQGAEYVSILTHKYKVAHRCKCEITALHKDVFLPFENVMIPVPANYDILLHRMYGDYLKFPPVEERGAWHENLIHFEPDISYRVYLTNEEKENRK